MPKYYGEIGFAITEETKPGLVEEVFTERSYYGDILKSSRYLQSNEYLNDNVNISNSFSIVADPYALNNIYAMRYLVWMGVKWRISSVDVEYPRIILTVGGVYNT